jgi:hypothetical protein
LPGRFTVEQTYRQWQPELGRRLTCEAATPVPAINWSATTPGGLLVNLRGPFTAHVFRRGRQQEASTVGSSGVPLPTDLLVALSEFRKGVRLGPRYQMSPTGGATLADVPVMDGSDDRQRVAVVLTAVGDDFVVYRQVSYER